MINKRKITGVIGLIFISPLLMAVSRYSETNNEYSQIEIAVDNVKEDPDGEDTSLYDLTIKNTGKGYIRCIEYSEGGRRSTTFYMEDETSPITASPLLKAYSECKYENFRWYTDEEFPKGSFTATAYDNYYAHIDVNNVSIIKGEEEHIFLIQCDSPKNDYDYGYNFIITMEYEGVEHCFVLSGTNEGGNLTIIGKEGFDESKAKITDFDVYRYEFYHTNYVGFALGGALYALLTYVLPVVIVAVIVVVVLIIVTRIIKNKSKQNKGQ